MVWDKPEIIKALKKLHKKGVNLSYNALAAEQQSLVSAAAYHFGSYRKAIEKAGIGYESIIRRPRWNKTAIIVLIKQARREEQDLHWSAVTKRRDELGKAAFASLQPRLFGSWDRALTASGLDADVVNRYRKWNKDTISQELKQRAKEHQALNSGALQVEEPGLHAAAVRHFGSYDGALRAAKLDPEKLRQRRSWTKQAVKIAMKEAAKEGRHLSDSAVRRQDPALYGAAIRLFGSFTVARSAAGIKFRE